MARTYKRIGEPDQHGMRDVVTTQKLEGMTEPQEITYRTFGNDNPDRADLWITYVANVLKSAPADDKLEWYDEWVYGRDLGARQTGKSGGPVDPWVPYAKTEEWNIVTGVFRVRETKAETGKVQPEDVRVDFVNMAEFNAKAYGKQVPKSVETGKSGLIAAGIAREDGGRLVLIPEAERPKAPAPNAPAPEPPKPQPTARRRGSK